MPSESDIVDAAIRDEPNEVQFPDVVVIGRGQRSKPNTMLHLDMPSIEFGVVRT